MDAAVLIRQTWQLLEADLQALGYELIEVELARQSGAPVLRVYIDKEGGGISLEDCTRATHTLNVVLDASDLINDRYMLEVSSPGWNRPLRKVAHFERYVDEKVRVTTNAPVEGRTRFKGVLLGVDNDVIRIDVSGQILDIHLENIKKARLDR